MTYDNQRLYTPEWFAEDEARRRASAARVVAALLDVVGPSSVLDVGCGDGTFLRAFAEAGVAEADGVDGPWITAETFKADFDRFTARDLRAPLPLDRTYDLAVSLEVAEHLEPEHAGRFVGDLCRAAPVVAFSAAVPGQGGTNHLHERWPSYWAGLFAAEGYACFDPVRPRIWDDDDVMTWYRQNLLVYVSAEATDVAERLAPWQSGPYVDVVHPALFSRAAAAESRYQRAARGEPGALSLKDLLRLLPPTLRHAAARRLGAAD